MSSRRQGRRVSPSDQSVSSRNSSASDHRKISRSAHDRRSSFQTHYFQYVSRHTPHACNCVKTCSERARTKLCPSFAFVFHLGISFFGGFGKGVTDPGRPPNPPSTGEGLRHPLLLSTIATAIATWLGALSHSNGRWVHRRGGARVGEVLRKSTRGNYGERVSRTTQKTAHRPSHRAPYLPPWRDRHRISHNRASSWDESPFHRPSS